MVPISRFYTVRLAYTLQTPFPRRRRERVLRPTIRPLSGQERCGWVALVRASCGPRTSLSDIVIFAGLALKGIVVMGRNNVRVASRATTITRRSPTDQTQAKEIAVSIVKHNKARLTLLATMVAATSALAAAPVHAAKAPPTISGGGDISCDDPSGRVTASFGIAGKGKWAYIDIAVKVGDHLNDPIWDDKRVDRTQDKIDFDTVIGADGFQDVALVATMVNKKGAEFEGSADSKIETRAVDCQ